MSLSNLITQWEIFKIQIWLCHPFIIPFPPPQTFNSFSSLGIKPKLLTCSRKYCVPGHSWPLQPHLLPRLSSFSPSQKHCLSCVLCFFLLEATLLDLRYSPDSLTPFPQPLIWVETSLPQSGIPVIHEDKFSRRDPSGQFTLLLTIAV